MKTSKAMLAIAAILASLALLVSCGGGAATTTTMATTTMATTTVATTTMATTSAATSATTRPGTSVTTTMAGGTTTTMAGTSVTTTGTAGGTTTTRPGTAGTTDMVATASIVDTPEAFEKAISRQGYWLIATLKDLTFTKDLLLDGDFPNGRKDTAGQDVYQRKIGLYTQDANRNVTNRFKLTAPKLTINSRNPSLEHGTFIGDIYVAVPNFKLIDATVQGNVYFKTQDVRNTFTMDATSRITGTQEVRSF